MVVRHLPGYANATNPHTGLLCDALKAAGVDAGDFGIRVALRSPRPEVVHVHWPEWWLTRSPWEEAKRQRRKLMLGVGIAKLRGAKLFWTIHNLRPHERFYPEAETAFYRKWIPMVDGFISLSESGLNMAEQAYPFIREKPRWIIPRGDYRPMLKGVTREAARYDLGIASDSLVLCHFGMIRPYKGIPNLIQNFRKVRRDFAASQHRPLHLLIAGGVSDEKLAETIRSEADGDENVQLDLRFLADDELESVAVASDLIVLPYSDILNSGSAIYALSCGRPILVPETGALPELRKNVGESWVRFFHNELGARNLGEALSELQALPPQGQPDLSLYSWEEAGRRIRDAYAYVLNPKSRFTPSAGMRLPEK